MNTFENADHNIIFTFVTFDWLIWISFGRTIEYSANQIEYSLSPPLKSIGYQITLLHPWQKNTLHKVLILELVIFSLKYKTTKKLLIPSAANYRRRSRSLNHHDGECKVITQIPFKASWCLTVQVFSRKTHSFSCIFWEISQTPWTTKQ